MKEELKDYEEKWNDDCYDDDYSDEEEECWVEEMRESAWRRLRFWSEMQARGCHWTIVTPYYNIVDGRMEFKEPPKKSIITADMIEPMTPQERKRWRKAFEKALTRMFEGFNKEDYMEGWRKRMRQLSL